MKYVLTVHHFRRDMMFMARNNILIQKIPLSIIFKTSTGRVWNLEKNTGDLVLRKKLRIFSETR